MSEYSFLINSIIYSTSIVFISMMLAITTNYFLIIICSLSKIYYKIFYSVFSIINYVPATCLLLLFIYALGTNYILKILFMFLVATAYMFDNLLNDNYKKEIYFAKMIGLNNLNIATKILVKLHTPNIVKMASKTTVLMWTYLVLLESIDTNFGIGNLINSAINIGELKIFGLGIFLIIIINFFTVMICKFILNQYIKTNRMN